VKTILFSIPLLFVFGLSVSSELASAQTATPPSYCHPCLFYGGDFDASNPAANALGNGLLYSGSPAAVYVPFFIPSGQVWTVTGFFSNNLSSSSFLDPAEIKWSISTGISAENPGTLIGQGRIPATYTPTGRSFDGLTEYTSLGHLPRAKAITLTHGIYWMTAIPICTDPSCGDANFYLSDVEDIPAPNHKGIEPNDDSFYFWTGGNYFFAPTAYPNGVCNGGGDGTGCDRFSAGLLGYAKPAQ
jgi:hypothetical protein